MNNDELRVKISDAGITTENVIGEHLKILHSRLSEALEASDCFRGTFKMDPLKDREYMTCSSDYFQKREAVSFNSDGFIGFAGWSSSKNLIPIQAGVIDWLAEISL